MTVKRTLQLPGCWMVSRIYPPDIRILLRPDIQIHLRPDIRILLQQVIRTLALPDIRPLVPRQACHQPAGKPPTVYIRDGFNAMLHFLAHIDRVSVLCIRSRDPVFFSSSKMSFNVILFTILLGVLMGKYFSLILR